MAWGRTAEALTPGAPSGGGVRGLPVASGFRFHGYGGARQCHRLIVCQLNSKPAGLRAAGRGDRQREAGPDPDRGRKAAPRSRQSCAPFPEDVPRPLAPSSPTNGPGPPPPPTSPPPAADRTLPAPGGDRQPAPEGLPGGAARGGEGNGAILSVPNAPPLPSWGSSQNPDPPFPPQAPAASPEGPASS